MREDERRQAAGAILKVRLSWWMNKMNESTKSRRLAAPLRVWWFVLSSGAVVGYGRCSANGSAKESERRQEDKPTTKQRKWKRERRWNEIDFFCLRSGVRPQQSKRINEWNEAAPRGGKAGQRNAFGGMNEVNGAGLASSFLISGLWAPPLYRAPIPLHQLFAAFVSCCLLVH